jgi:hypothetical protein
MFTKSNLSSILFSSVDKAPIEPVAWLKGPPIGTEDKYFVRVLLDWIPLFGFLTPEDGTDSLLPNVSKKLALLTA